jgi:hypothetical protein
MQFDFPEEDLVHDQVESEKIERLNRSFQPSVIPTCFQRNGKK